MASRVCTFLRVLARFARTIREAKQLRLFRRLSRTVCRVLLLLPLAVPLSGESAPTAQNSRVPPGVPASLVQDNESIPRQSSSDVLEGLSRPALLVIMLPPAEAWF